MPLTETDHVTRIRQDSLFIDLANSQVARLLGHLQSVEFAAGNFLYAKDTASEFLYLIEEGLVQLTTPGGRTSVLIGLRCGEEAASDMTDYLCSATAITPVKAIRIPRTVLNELAAETPSFRTRALLGLTEELSGEKLQKTAVLSRASDTPISRREAAGWICAIGVPPAIYFVASAEGLLVEAALFLAILSATVLMWLFSLADEFVPLQQY